MFIFVMFVDLCQFASTGGCIKHTYYSGPCLKWIDKSATVVCSRVKRQRRDSVSIVLSQLCDVQRSSHEIQQKIYMHMKMIAQAKPSSRHVLKTRTPKYMHCYNVLCKSVI